MKEKNNGIDIIVNKERNIYNDLMKTSSDSHVRVPQIPVHVSPSGIALRQCTFEYKINPVVQSTRKLHGLKPRKRMKPTEMWLGISLDEMQRMKKSSMYNIEFFYPLIYNGMDRSDCIKFFKKNNFPTPIKSSCVFCPYHSNDFWKDLKKENGSAWKMSIEVDKKIRKKQGMKGDMYLHPSLKPLEDIEFEDNQLTMEGFECEGHCGL